MKKIFIKIDNHIKRNFLWYDLSKSVIILALFLYIVDLYALETQIRSFIDESRKTLYSAIATIAGAILGFVITGVAIIIGLGDENGLKKLRRSKYFSQIYESYFKAIIYLAITTFLGIAGIIFNGFTINIWLFYANFWGVTISVISVSRCVYFLKMMVKIITEANKS